jgi:hypothetical protein
LGVPKASLFTHEGNLVIEYKYRSGFRNRRIEAIDQNGIAVGSKKGADLTTSGKLTNRMDEIVGRLEITYPGTITGEYLGKSFELSNFRYKQRIILADLLYEGGVIAVLSRNLETVPHPLEGEVDIEVVNNSLIDLIYLISGNLSIFYVQSIISISDLPPIDQSMDGMPKPQFKKLEITPSGSGYVAIDQNEAQYIVKKSSRKSWIIKDQSESNYKIVKRKNNHWEIRNSQFDTSVITFPGNNMLHGKLLMQNTLKTQVLLTLNFRQKIYFIHPAVEIIQKQFKILFKKFNFKNQIPKEIRILDHKDNVLMTVIGNNFLSESTNVIYDSIHVEYSNQFSVNDATCIGVVLVELLFTWMRSKSG